MITIRTCVEQRNEPLCRKIVWSGKQSAALRTGHRGNINDLSDIEAWGTGNGDRWGESEEKKGGQESDISRGRQRDMEECSYCSKPEKSWSAKSAPLPPRLDHKSEDSSGWLACGLHLYEEEGRVGFFFLIKVPQTLIWSESFRNTQK